MNEIVFLVEENPEGGYSARALGEAIFTAAATPEDLQRMISDAVACHFDEGAAAAPARIITEPCT